MVSGLILASGYGVRLKKHINMPKYFVDVKGKPLIYYPITSLYRGGVRDIYIIVNNEIYRRLELIRDILDMYSINIIVNPYPELDNGYTLLYGLERICGDYVLVSVSDHIYPPIVVKNLLDRIRSGGDFYIAGDPDPIYIDVIEATKIRVGRDNRVLKVGKDLSIYDYIDMGVFLFSRGIFRYLDVGRESMSISNLINKVISGGGEGYVVPFEGIEWKDVDTIDDLKFVRSRLFGEVLKKFFEV